MLAAGAALGGTALGAFAAGMLLPPIASWIQRHHSIPDQVVFLPCFWMLVPGATGLRGVSELLADQGTGSLATLVTTLVTVVAIALGIVVGAGLQHRTRLEVATGDETVDHG
ncbi:threonine/serine exporter family protein [Streptacidiphilus sp. PAMC 29251]